MAMRLRRMTELTERRRDVRGEQVEVRAGLILLEGTKAKPLPPAPCVCVDRRRDDGTAGHLFTELEREGENVCEKRRSDASTGAAAINRKVPDQQCRDRVWRMPHEPSRRGRSIYPCHCDARVRDNLVRLIRDHPGGRGVPPPVLAGVATQPAIQRGVATSKRGSAVKPRIERRRPPQLWPPRPPRLSQARRSRVGAVERSRAAR